MNTPSTLVAAQRVIITVPLPQWALRFNAKGEEVLFHYARPFRFGICSGPAGSEMAFEEKPGIWVRTSDANIRLGDGGGVFLVDASAVAALRALFLDKCLSGDPQQWERLEPWFRKHAPYCYGRLKDGSLLAINRNYAPLAAPDSPHANCERHAEQAERFICDPRAMEGIFTHVHDDGARAYLIATISPAATATSGGC